MGAEVLIGRHRRRNLIAEPFLLLLHQSQFVAVLAQELLEDGDVVGVVGGRFDVGIHECQQLHEVLLSAGDQP